MWYYNYMTQLYHHGVKGQKWGVRRTPEQLGHMPKNLDRYDPAAKRDIQNSNIRRSSKKFFIQNGKIDGYMLNPNGKHSQEFFNVGYSPKDSQKLFDDIERQYDTKNAVNRRIDERGRIRYSIPMELGVTQKKPFNTAWIKDFPRATPRLITCHRTDGGKK